MLINRIWHLITYNDRLTIKPNFAQSVGAVEYTDCFSAEG